jgi:hypothetical protein
VCACLYKRRRSTNRDIFPKLLNEAASRGRPRFAAKDGKSYCTPAGEFGSAKSTSRQSRCRHTRIGQPRPRPAEMLGNHCTSGTHWLPLYTESGIIACLFPDPFDSSEVKTSLARSSPAAGYDEISVSLLDTKGIEQDRSIPGGISIERTREEPGAITQPE